MKKIEAVIRTEALAAAQAALQDAGLRGMTVTAVLGTGREAEACRAFGSRRFAQDFLPKLKLEVLVRDADVRRVVDQLLAAARTGAAGNGHLIVLPLEAVYCVRTGETAEAAV